MKGLRVFNAIMGCLFVFAGGCVVSAPICAVRLNNLFCAHTAIYAYIKGDVEGATDFFASIYTMFFGLLLVAYELRIGRIETKARGF